jgi:Fuc2NAc and GlcNAc transferase
MVPFNLSSYLIGAPIGLFLGSMGITYFMIGYAHRHGRLDIPNSRSSHQTPTPRGGGVSIVAMVLTAAALEWFLFPLSRIWILPLAVSGFMVAFIGWLDDWKSLSARLKLGVHLVSALIFVWYSGVLSVDGGLLAFALIIAILGLGWILNLYNFMDGIDGIAAGEGVTVGISGVLLASLSRSSELAFIYSALTCASFGFLIFNWPPARIFMGDVASGFMGFCFGALALVAASTGKIPLSASLIVLGVFIVDATYTLIARALKGKALHVAHRDHAYQHAALRWGHKRATLGTLMINVCWLLPLAIWATIKPEWQWICLGAAYLPLVGLVVYFRYEAGDGTN